MLIEVGNEGAIGMEQAASCPNISSSSIAPLFKSLLYCAFGGKCTLKCCKTMVSPWGERRKYPGRFRCLLSAFVQLIVPVFTVWNGSSFCGTVLTHKKFGGEDCRTFWLRPKSLGLTRRWLPHRERLTQCGANSVFSKCGTEKSFTSIHLSESYCFIATWTRRNNRMNRAHS